ncbi:MAG: hypothetical protein WD025_07920 [Bacteriovoracaceae bacterium]
MSNSTFPALLNRRAKMLGNLNRSDLIFVGGTFLVSSYLKISGITGLLLNLSLLAIFKILSSKLPKGFVEQVMAPKELAWKKKFGGDDE